MERGIPQGGSLSPLLFTITMDELQKQARETLKEGDKIAGYADDKYAVISSHTTATSGGRVKEVVRGIKKAAQDRGLNVEERKSAVIAEEIPNNRKMIGGIKVVTKLKKLGITYQKNERATQHLKNLERDNNLISKLKRTRMKTKVILDAYRSYAIAKAHYGCHRWITSMKGADRDKLRKIQAKWGKAAFRLPWNTDNIKQLP